MTTTSRRSVLKYSAAAAAATLAPRTVFAQAVKPIKIGVIYDLSGPFAAAGSVPVSVRNPDGQTTGSQTFTINPSGGGGGDTIKVIITAPAAGATVKGTVWFTVWLENAAAGTKTVTLSVNGTTITSTTGTANGPYSLPWSTTAADNGSRTATITVRDSANATGRASITVNVAN